MTNLKDGSGPRGYKIGGHPAVSGTQNITINPLVALYSSRLLSKAFWDDPNTPRKSDDYFHRNQLFSSITQKVPGRPKDWSTITLDQNKISSGRLLPGDMDSGE